MACMDRTNLAKESSVPESHHYQDCTDDHCKDCQWLVDNGFVIACDECDMPGQADADGWLMQPDGLIFCLACADKAKAESENK